MVPKSRMGVSVSFWTGCKMLTVPRVCQAINIGDWFAIIDLKDVYF